ncbi:MAG: aspartate/glutamate racemase family protein [Candidatus Aminicenantes bacterium]|nr:aspartate/glutamate racemase family protein [Candidatus Aminicenantes bacterium]HHF52419.1 aspartate/glutamate racemase family protein [Candidatus Aminicenantes bacterium]
MKTIGLIGGMSWESSLEYYRILNQAVKEKLGGFHSAKCLMYSVDFEEIEKLQHKGRWDELTDIMIDAAQRVEKAGADFIVICTNTMHKMAPEVESCLTVPLLHIADVTAEQIKIKGQKKVGLLGTRFTMEQEFYKGRLTKTHGIEVIIPYEEQRKIIHNILYKELVKGEISKVSKNKFKDIISSLSSRGAEGIILGCTEIPLLVKQEDYDIPLYDTTDIHARAAVELALRE